MKKMTDHYQCFSAEEFWVLMSAMKNPSLVAYQCKGINNTQEAYNTGVFSLYKRGIIKNADTDGKFELESRYKSMLFALDNCSAVLTISVNGEDARYCIYCVKGITDNYVITKPGSRKNEYILIREVNEEGFRNFFEHSEFFEGRVLMDNVEMQVMDPGDGMVTALIQFFSQQITDEIRVVYGVHSEIFRYTKEKALEIIFRVIGGNYDIS